MGVLTMHSLGHHHADELLVVNVTITVDIGLTDHLIDFLVGELLTEVGHDVTKLGSGYQTVTITIEDLEGLNQLFFCVSVLHLTGHEGEELREIDGTVAVSIDFIDHVPELSFSGVLTKGSHDSSELLGGDGAITVPM